MNRNVRKTIQRSRWHKLWLVVMFLFLGELFLYTWARVQCTRTGYDISRQNAQHQELSALQANLKIELARLRSPQRISKYAREKLGLVSPTPSQMVVLP